MSISVCDSGNSPGPSQAFSSKIKIQDIWWRRLTTETAVALSDACGKSTNCGSDFSQGLSGVQKSQLNLMGGFLEEVVPKVEFNR